MFNKKRVVEDFLDETRFPWYKRCHFLYSSSLLLQVNLIYFLLLTNITRSIIFNYQQNSYKLMSQLRISKPLNCFLFLWSLWNYCNQIKKDHFFLLESSSDDSVPESSFLSSLPISSSPVCSSCASTSGWIPSITQQELCSQDRKLNSEN